MAVDRGTIQLLQTANKLIEAEALKRTRSEEKAMQVLGLRVRSEEAELDRTSRHLMSLEDDVSKLETEYAKLVGAQKAIAKNREQSGLRSEAGAVIENEKSRLASDREGMLSQIGDLRTRKEELLAGLGEYSRGYGLGSGLYEQYRMSEGEGLVDQATVGTDEFARLREDLGAELTPEAEAGIRRRFSEMQGPMLGLLGKQAEMVLAQSRHELDREQFKYDKWYKSEMLKAARLKAQNEGSKAANEKLDDLRKSAINSYLQRKSTLEDMNREFDISKGGLFLPDVLSSANDVKQAQNSIASNIADYAIQFDDSNVPDKYRELMNEYKKYKGLGNEEKQLQAATKLVNAVLNSEDGPTSLLQNLDYSSWWPFAGSDQPEKTQYGSHLFGAYQALTKYQDAATLKNANHEEIAKKADALFSSTGAASEAQAAPVSKKEELDPSNYYLVEPPNVFGIVTNQHDPYVRRHAEIYSEAKKLLSTGDPQYAALLKSMSEYTKIAQDPSYTAESAQIYIAIKSILEDLKKAK